MHKIGFVVTNHQSQKLRPQGRELLYAFIESLEQSCKHPFELYVVDNGSEEPLEKNEKFLITEGVNIG